MQNINASLTLGNLQVIVETSGVSLYEDDEDTNEHLYIHLSLDQAEILAHYLLLIIKLTKEER